MADGPNDPKKDLTSIVEYSKKLAKEGKLPEPTIDGAVLQETPIEKIDVFESLEEYSKTHPTEPPPPPEATEAGQSQPAELVLDSLSDTPEAPSEPQQQPESEFLPELQSSPESAPEESTAAEPPALGSNPADTGLPSLDGIPGLEQASTSDLSGAVTGIRSNDTSNSDGMAAEVPDFAPPEQLAGIESTGATGSAPTQDSLSLEPSLASSPESFVDSPLAPEPLSPEPTPALESEPEAPAAPAQPAPAPATPMEKVKKFAERVTVGKPAIQAALPFSVLIEGRLDASEREKLVDLLNHHNMGIREVDLEPQFEAGRILIPRISEYAAVLIVQAMRNISARIRFGLSDSVFSTADTRADDEAPLSADVMVESSSTSSPDPLHPAESILITPQATLPNQRQFEVIDTISASASLKSNVVEAETSSEYQEILDALQRELKYKAHRRGASAILNFNVTLTPLSLPTRYRLTVIGAAVRPKAQTEMTELDATPAL